MVAIFRQETSCCCFVCHLEAERLLWLVLNGEIFGNPIPEASLGRDGHETTFELPKKR
jgi:hypothetical protein